MEFDKRTILAFVLIGVVLLIASSQWYQRLILPSDQSGSVVERTETDTTSYRFGPDTTVRTNESEEQAAPQETLVGQQQETQEPSVPKPYVEKAVKEGKPIVVETDLYHAVFNTRGAVLREWTLKKYERFDSTLVQLIASDENQSGNLAIVIPTFADTIDTELLPFQADTTGLILDASRDRGELAFRLDLGEGRVVEKRMVFWNDKYSFDLEVRLYKFGDIVRDFKYIVKWESGLLPTERDINHDMRYAKAYVLTKGDLISQSVGKTKPVTHPVLWAAARTKYFAVALIPRSREAVGAQIAGHEKELPGGQMLRAYELGLEMPLVRKNAVVDSFTVYLGPLDYRIVKKYHAGLEQMMNFGWRIIRPISIAVLLSLQALHKVIPNYGVVLILFSLMIKIVVYPLTRKSYQSMKRMQQLQPKMAELKEKYAKDPQRLNRETMKLYKEHGVNPLGGCLPTLLQMPLLYALFIVFQSTIELRGAGFVAWITDLSAPDTIAHLPFTLPFYGNNVNVLPIVMGLTMLWQQKMTMQDPKQKAMVYMMPILFTFLFNNFPSGLTLYYTVFNAFTIVQQKMIKDTEKPAAPVKDGGRVKKQRQKTIGARR